eukprot:1252544-Amphidinium_carterae.1
MELVGLPKQKNNASKATELAEIGKALQVGESFSSGSAASSSRSAGQEKKKPSRGMEPDIITKE